MIDTCIFCNQPSAAMTAHASGVGLGKLMERDRIIKLLDTDFWHHRMIGDSGEIICLPSCDMCKLIVVIKGNK